MASIHVQLVFAKDSHHIWQQSLILTEDSTVADAVAQSQLSDIIPQFSWDTMGVAIFGRKVMPDDRLNNADRIEICRQLNFDPKESRKRRAAHRQAGILKKKHLKPDRAKKIEYDEYK